jgi:protein-disulfide isomerase
MQMKWFGVGLTIALSLVPSCCSAAGCKAPTTEKQASIAFYVAKRYHVGQVSLVESVQANDSCFWRLRLQSASLKNDLVLYLSPDGQYLTPGLFDINIDPLIEERASAEKLMKSLLMDSPPSVGELDAPITIVEFSDFQCSYCKRMTDVFDKDLTQDERASIRLVFRSFPLSIHPWARTAAEIAGCARLQSNDAFWGMSNYLFDNQKGLTEDNVRTNVDSFVLANGVIKKGQFDECLSKRLSAAGVSQDMELGTRYGVHVTPTLFINGVKYEGAKDVTQLRAIIAEMKASRSTGYTANTTSWNVGKQ